MPWTPPQKDLGTQLTTINRTFEEKSTEDEAKRRGLEYVNLAAVVINPDLLLIVDEARARGAEAMLYYRVGKRLRVAVRNPENPATKELLEQLHATGYKVNVTLTSASSLEDGYRAYRESKMHAVVAPHSVVQDQSATRGTSEEELKTLTQVRDEVRKANAADAVMTILTAATRANASDIHLEPYGDIVHLRLRIDGVLQDVFDLDLDRAKYVIEQFKHMARMKINISNQPQDGRFTFRVGDREVDARVSSLPTVEGETVVMRLLDNQRRILDLSGLGLRGLALEHVLAALREPHGMILSTGPTGSGKTTTLYSMLFLINTPEKKVITLEDPVEYRVRGISQSQVSQNDEYTFAKGLRAILRQDPDIVMVGEIRDLETAEIAAQAAMTGHVVLSTLHTNDAVSAIPRLVNMGLRSYIVAPSLGIVLAQRLVRRVCKDCGVQKALTSGEQRTMNDVIKSLASVGVDLAFPPTVFTAVGCDLCSHTGYRGQVGIFEAFRISDDMRQMILDEKSLHDLLAAARKEGMVTMREDAFMKVAEGLTTIAEVERVTGSQ